MYSVIPWYRKSTVLGTSGRVRLSLLSLLFFPLDSTDIRQYRLDPHPSPRAMQARMITVNRVLCSKSHSAPFTLPQERGKEDV